jgi:transcriptional regulator with XRE-family HTH domain
MRQREPLKPVPVEWVVDLTAFGIWLKETRTELGLSQTELAELINDYQPTISQLEAGNIGFGMSRYCHLATALGLTPWELLRHLIYPADLYDL